ncbi:hypothetical protein [Streptomyces lomondensis]|nr:hypothetical protein [Streptomyces lomondensis]
MVREPDHADVVVVVAASALEDVVDGRGGQLCLQARSARLRER